MKNTAILTSAIALTLGLSSCTQKPTDAQLEQWHRETIAANSALIVQHAFDPRRTEDWMLTIQGQIASENPVEFNSFELAKLATTTVRTRSPFHESNKAVIEFQGIRISDLLDRIDLATNIDELTLLAFDNYRATISIADVYRYPIIIALKKDEIPLSRSEGGPLFVVFPKSDYPELEDKYSQSDWVFYVTDLIVGTEPINFTVNGQKFKAGDLDKLPSLTLKQEVGYRNGWPSNAVELHGYRLRDILAATEVDLPAEGSIIVRGKAPLYAQSKTPIQIEISDVRNCDILLATGWSNPWQPIPARLGGPVALALPNTCKTANGEEKSLSENLPWVTFVEDVEIVN